MDWKENRDKEKQIIAKIRKFFFVHIFENKVSILCRKSPKTGSSVSGKSERANNNFGSQLCKFCMIF